jgi:beta-lactamase regulating signal transducer with metallopeptidase domain
MEALLIYQVKVAVLVAVLFGGYRLLLGRETFHRFNRSVLITIALLSFVLPLFHITRQAKQQPQFQPEAAVETQLEADDVVSAQKPLRVNPVVILLVLYGAGVVYVLVRKGVSVLAVSRIIRKGRYADRAEGVDVIESDQIPGPLNWMRYVVMPREWLESENASVWKHENLHAHRWHSLDLLMADVMTAFQWFNPVMILLRKEFELIHEYEADQAVIESGANAKEYKLMLVNAVAASRGLAMTSWLKQSNLKKRIDMMDKKQSNGWSRLRVLFIPAIAYLFLFATANVTVANAQDNTFRWPVFEDGKTWIFQDGSAKVRTFDGVTANMKASEVAGYLKNYTGFKTTRMTLMFEYPIESLADVQPYAEQLNAVGIKTSVATNEEMLERMTMPEFRVARVYDEGRGKYRFELICNSHDDRLRHYMNPNFEYKYKDISITGDKALMLKWIDMFDGHGLAIYPKSSMPTADMEQMAQAAWSRGIEQVSAVIDGESDMGDLKLYTLVPKEGLLSKKFPGVNAYEAIRKYNASRSSDYFSKGVHIEKPRSFYNAGSSFLNVTDVVRTPDELILIFKSIQYTDLWIMTSEDWVIDVDGQKYKFSKYEGLNDMIGIHYWSPDNGYFISSVHFDVAIPDDVKTVDLLDEDSEAISGLQISETPVDYDDIRVVHENSTFVLKTTHREKDAERDYVSVHRIDFSADETKVYASMTIAQSHAFPGHLGSDITLTLSDGTVLNAVKVLGVPTDQDFDRHGDFVQTGFKVIFPPISQEDWEKGINIFRATVCHEPVSIELNRPRPAGPTVTLTDEIAAGEYHAEIAKYEFADDGAGANRTESNTVDKVVFDSKGKMILSGSKSTILPDGKYTMNWIKPDKEKNPRDEGLAAEGLNKLELKGRKVKMEFMAELVKQGDEIMQYILVEENDKGATVMYIYPNK